MSINATQTSSPSNWTVVVSVSITYGFVMNYSFTSTRRRGRSLMASLDSWVAEDLFQPSHGGSAYPGINFAEAVDGMASEGHDGSRTLLFDALPSPNAAEVRLALSTPAGRAASAWVKQRAVPVLQRARRDLASTLRQLEVMSQRLLPEEEASSDDAPFMGRRSLTSSNASIYTSPQDIVTLAQIMSVLSSLNTLSVSPDNLTIYVYTSTYLF